jgi:hypothetical protein
MTHDSFDVPGFAIEPDVLAPHECDLIGQRIRSDTLSGGTRNMLSEGWCRDLAARLLRHPKLANMMGDGDVAVQCTYFEKSLVRNWLVALHQDLSIPVAQKVDEPRLKGWSMKEGAWFVQAPVELLEKMVAIRIHLDDCTERDGPLRVVPGSHRLGVVDEYSSAQICMPEVTCTATRGSAMVMRPLLLHASSKACGSSRRRLLHFLFGPAVLPYGLRWRHGPVQAIHSSLAASITAE